VGLELFDDMTEATGIIPTYGMRLLVGLLDDGSDAVVYTHSGEINGTTLVGILETIKHRILEG
jgi:hypothetical protein